MQEGISMTTLLDSFNGLLTPQLVSGLAGQLGTNEATVGPSLRTTCAAILAALVGKSSESGTMAQIASLLGDAGLGSVLSNPAAAIAPTSPANGLANRFLSTLFGDRLDSTAAGLVETTGLRSGTGPSLMRMATPLVMGLLADRMRRSGGGLSALTSLLGSERRDILAAVPAGLGRMLGLDTVAATRLPVEPVRTTSRRWLWPAVAALALFGLWSMFRARPAGERPSVMAIGETGADLGRTVRRQLPSNVEIDVPGRSLEAELLGFLDQNRPLEPPTWFNFDRLLFDTGQATLRPESRPQIVNIVEILKAYPTVGVKIGGYTDNVGDPASNLQLSQARATTVMNELAALGIASTRMSAEGYGEQHPVADNTTEAGRAQNRRIALRVTQR
jgi:outer membrane protein OmpA-like peptidoglycan-associated protein